MTKVKSFAVGIIDKEISGVYDDIIFGAKIYQSNGLIKHIQKRHPSCVKYIPIIPEIISNPDSIGRNPNEKGVSFELVKNI